MSNNVTAEQKADFEKYYNAMMDLFGSDGWNFLKNDLSNSAISINSVEHTKDLEDLYVRKGQLMVLANLLNLEDQMETLRQQQEEDETSTEDA